MRRKGFTLIELLVVISIIALLLSIMMPALTKVKEAGRRTICATRTKGLTTAIYAYATKNKDNVPTTKPGMNAAWGNTLYAYFPGAAITPKPIDGWDGLGLLHKENLVEDGEAFYCPSQKHPALDPDLYFPGKSFTGVSGKLPQSFKSASERSSALGSLTYGLIGQADNADESDKAALVISDTKLYKLKDRPLVTDVFIPLKDNGVYKSSFAHTGKKGGLNVGYGDGSVSFVRLTQSVFETANELKAYDGARAELYRADLFAATMMKLLVNQPKYMEKYFGPGNPPFGINQ